MATNITLLTRDKTQATNLLNQNVEKKTETKKGSFTTQPNFTYDFVQSKISPTDWSVFSSLIRMLVGWNITRNWVSNKVLESKTGLTENTIRTSLKRLQKYKIIEVQQIIKNGFKHQFIELNLDPDTYMIQTKEKFSDKVRNFFLNKPKEKMEQPPQDLMPLVFHDPTSNGKVKPPQNANLTTANLEANKDIINNKENHKHKIKEKNDDDDFKFYNELEELGDSDGYIEQKINNKNESSIEKLLTTKYELNKKYIPNWNSIINIPQNLIMNEIEKAEDLKHQGKIKAEKGKISGLLIKNLTKLSIELEKNNKVTKSSESEQITNYFKIFDIHQKLSEKYSFSKMPRLNGITGKNQTELELSSDIFRKANLLNEAYKDNNQNDSFVKRIELGLRDFFIEVSKSIGFHNFISFMKENLGNFRKENNELNLNFMINFYNQKGLNSM